MKRKIIQIAVAAIGIASGDDDPGLDPDLYAVCDDGTLWNFWRQTWIAMPPIPQGNVVLAKADEVSQ